MKRILIDMKTYSSGKSCTVASSIEARRSGTDEELERLLDFRYLYGGGRP